MDRNYTYILTVLLLTLSLVGCNRSRQDHPTVTYTAENALIVDSSCVIFITPDTTEIARMHAQNTDEDYQAWVSQVTWYPGIATTALNARGINTKSCHDKQFIVLRMSKKEEIIMEPTKLSGDMILFNAKKKPFIVNSEDFENNKVFILRYFDK